MALIADLVASIGAAHFMIAGDFNFVPDASDSRNPSSLTSSIAADPECEDWTNLLGGFTEVFQPEFTHSGGRLHRWARLDRVYSSLPWSSSRQVTSEPRPWTLLMIGSAAGSRTTGR